jgi:V8-like Glu-specific endopeptidase
MKSLVAGILAALLCVAGVFADEGMWTFDNVPRAEISKKYGVQLNDDWLHHLQGSVVRLSGCTGSLVSSDGLVLTNHHCAASCLAENSTPQRDLLAGGFIADRREQEIRCQNEQISVLMDTQNVTAEVTRAVAGAQAADAARTRNQILTNLEQRCETDAKQAGQPRKCEAVTLYQGGQYWLYKYKRYDDVRLAFAPEDAIAAFGGDPDNFQFPRWCLDMSLMRVYENGKPASTPTHLSFDWSGAKDGEPVFVAGHPGTTERLKTVAQLKTERDDYLPLWLVRYSELRGRLLQYSKLSPEAARQAKDYLDTIENSIKVRRMQLASLLDDRLMDRKIADERKLRDLVNAKPDLKSKAGSAWDDIARAEARYRDILGPYTWIEGSAGFNSDLFGYARDIVRAAAERQKPNADRLREYTDARLPNVRQEIAADTPVYPQFEEVKLSFSLERMREYLGQDHPIIKRALGNATPDERAKALVEGSMLGDPKVRLALFDGGEQAVAASQDPMIVLAREIDDDARALRKVYENEVQTPEQRAQQSIAAARFAVYGTSVYPDATFTLRLSYGAVKGWTEAGKPVQPFTRLSTLYERATGAAPFALPKPWVDGKSKLDMNTAVNFVTTNDIVGGNSGSPVVNARGAIVGLIFDGNIHSISGTYWFDEQTNRAVAVHPAFIKTAMEQVYRAPALVRELEGGPAARQEAARP